MAGEFGRGASVDKTQFEEAPADRQPEQPIGLQVDATEVAAAKEAAAEATASASQHVRGSVKEAWENYSVSRQNRERTMMENNSMPADDYKPAGISTGFTMVMGDLKKARLGLT